MIRQEFTVDCVDWYVIVWYAVDCYHTERIIEDLVRIGCRGEDMRTAKENLLSCQYNNGITFTNNANRSSVIVIGLADSPEQYHNSITHERGHLAMHIAQILGLDPYGEKVRYVEGEIAQKMWQYEHILICPKCLKNLRNRLDM